MWRFTAAILAGMLLLAAGAQASAQDQICGPGQSSSPGDHGNIYISVAEIQSDGFTGLTAFRGGGEFVQVVTARVRADTNWVGYIQSIAEIQLGDILQAVGPWQDDCSLRATTVISPQVKPEGGFPQAGTGPGQGTSSSVPVVTISIAGMGLLLLVAGRMLWTARRRA